MSNRLAIPTAIENPSVALQVGRLFGTLDPANIADASERVRFEARDDFKTFMQLMFPGYLDGWHLELLRDALNRVERGECKRLIITMPPRHSKSLHVSEGFPAWYLGRHPDNRVIAATHTKRQANKNSLRVRQKFTDPNWPFDGVAISDERGGIEQWDIAASPTGGYFATGVGGRPAGTGGDLIIIDDPIGNQADADSALIRENLWDWYSGTLYTRRQPSAAIILTATRWHEDDLTGRLLSRMADGGEEWEELHLPAQLADGSYLWPEFWTEAEYEKAKMAADRVWLAQYQGRPSREGGNLLKEEWFPAVVPGEQYVEMYQSWDCAEEPGVTNDYSVCTTIGVGVSTYDVLHVWRDRVAFPDLEQAARDQASWVQAAYPGIPLTVVVEKKSAGTQLLQVLQATTRLPLVPYPSTEKDGKVQRVLRNTILAKSRRIRIMNPASWRTDFFREIKGFPNEAHDDIVDSFMIGIDSATGVGSMMATTTDYVDQQRRRQEGMRDSVSSRRRIPPPAP